MQLDHFCQFNFLHAFDMNINAQEQQSKLERYPIENPDFEVGFEASERKHTKAFISCSQL